MNVDTGEIRLWDSLTDAERTSGKWVKLPPFDADGRCEARRKTLVDDLFPPAQQDAARDLPSFMRGGIPGAPGSERRGGFDAMGRPR